MPGKCILKECISYHSICRVWCYSTSSVSLMAAFRLLRKAVHSMCTIVHWFINMKSVDMWREACVCARKCVCECVMESCRVSVCFQHCVFMTKKEARGITTQDGICKGCILLLTSRCSFLSSDSLPLRSGLTDAAPQNHADVLWLHQPSRSYVTACTDSLLVISHHPWRLSPSAPGICCATSRPRRYRTLGCPWLGRELH